MLFNHGEGVPGDLAYCFGTEAAPLSRFNEAAPEIVKTNLFRYPGLLEAAL